MKTIEKIAAKSRDIYGAKPVTIAFLGDSVTHGCFECYKTGETSLDTVFDRKNAFSTRVGQMLGILYPNAQVNIVNSGISGDCATNGNNRLERDVLSCNPDLVVVSYGLNDSCSGLEAIENYAIALKSIFTRLQEKGIEVIFLTQNYMNTKTSVHIHDDYFKGLAEMFAGVQNGGILKKYFERATQVCDEMQIPVCDIYAKWEQMDKGGVDVTELLSNKFNHPIRELHYYTAIKLLETMFEN